MIDHTDPTFDATSPTSVERAVAQDAARRVWSFLRSIGVIRPGVAPDGTLGSWWAAGGPPLDVVAGALRDALGLDTNAPFHPLPEETVEETAARWMVEARGTPTHTAMLAPTLN